MKPTKSHLQWTSPLVGDLGLPLTSLAMILCLAPLTAAEEGVEKPAAGAVSSTATESQGSTSSAAPAAPASGAETTRPAATETLSRGVAEIVKMAEAGVSTTVIKTYVECSPIAYTLTDADIIALAKHKVPDEIVTTLLTKGAQQRSLVAQRKNEAATRAQAERNARFGGLDPESYDYFQYYYLQPRALSAAYQRLAPYSAGPWFGYPFGNRPFYPPRM